MISDAWYSVTEYHLRMGTKDNQGNSVNSIERAVNKLDALNCLEHTANRWQILCVIEENEKLLMMTDCSDVRQFMVPMQRVRQI